MRIAALRADRIGDLILTEPALRALKKYRASHLTLILNEASAPVLKGYRWADEIVTFSPTSEGLRELRNHNVEYDELFVFSPISIAYKAGLNVRAKKRYSYVYASRTLARAFWSMFYKMWVDPVDMAFPYTYRYGINHEIIQNLKLLELVGVKVPDEELDVELPLEASERERAEDMWNSLIAPNTPRVLVAGSRRLLNGLLVKRLVDELRREGLEPVITFAPNEREYAPTDLLENRTLTNLSLREFMALLATSHLVITANSAPMHMASAFKKPVVALFSKENFHFESLRWAPWRTYHRLVVSSEVLDDTLKNLTLNVIAAVKENNIKR